MAYIMKKGDVCLVVNQNRLNILIGVIYALDLAIWMHKDFTKMNSWNTEDYIWLISVPIFVAIQILAWFRNRRDGQ